MRQVLQHRFLPIWIVILALSVACQHQHNAVAENADVPKADLPTTGLDAHGFHTTLISAANVSKTAASEMRKHAKKGEFNKLLALIQNQQELRKDANVISLLGDLERHRKHQDKHTADRRAAYDKAFKKMQDLVAKKNLTEAVYSAIEANGLADDPKIMLAQNDVVVLVKATQTKAGKASVDHDWLEALSLYRALEMLFDDNSRHKKEIRGIERHLRLLRYYAPKKLEALYAVRRARFKAQRAKDKADEKNKEDDKDDKDKKDDKKTDKDKDGEEEDDKPIKVVIEPWQKRLKNIQMSMLRQTLSRAAHHHISNPGYEPLLAGAINALSVMAESKGLETAFPKFADAKRVKQFKEGLARINANLKKQKGAMNFLQASSFIDDVTDLNRETLDLPEPVLVYEMTDGATSRLDDFTSLIWPHDLEQFSRNIDGKFYGVGIQISSRNGRLTVVSPLEGTPAHRAGVRAGDVIAEVNGTRTDDWTLDKAVRIITGPEGTEVKLGIERPGERKLIPIAIKRAEIMIESIKGWDHRPGGGWTYYVDEKSKIGYVRLTQFIPQSVEGLDAAVKSMLKGKGLNGLVLDLRGNPGGLLSSAINICDRFVSEGTLVSTVNSSNRETRRYSASNDKTYPRIPLAILINQGSASASEIVSGAMQDYQRGLIVGDNSFGKGSVQDLFPIDGGTAALKLTTQYYRLPAGRIIHRKPGGKTWGIQPDLYVRMTTTQVADMIRYRQEVDIIRQDGEKPDGDKEIATAANILSKGLDPQLQAALLYIKTSLIANDIAIARNAK